MSDTTTTPAAGGPNDEKIRAAMQRLLAGQPAHTDGRLTVKNLADEAGLSRQQVYRSPLRAEFEEHVRRIGERGEAPTEKHLARITRLQQQLADAKARADRYRTERDDARAERDALANQIVALDEINRRLEAALGDAGKVTTLRR